MRNIRRPHPMQRLMRQLGTGLCIVIAMITAPISGGINARAATTPTTPAPLVPGLCTASQSGVQFQPSCAAVAVGPAAQPAATPCAPITMQCPIWSDTFDGLGTSVDMAFAAATDGQGATLFAGGYTTDNSTSIPGLVVAYDMATGARRWVNKHTGALQAMLVSSLQASADGSVVYAAGDQYSGGFAPCGTDVFALDGSTGALLWDSPLPVGDGGCPLYTDSVLSSDGTRLFVVSDIRDSQVQSQGQPVEQALLAAFDTATGQQLWIAHAPVSGYGYEHWRIAMAPDGSSVYVASGANSATPESPVAWAVFAYAVTTGVAEWSTAYDCTRGGGVFCAMPAGIAAADGRVYVLGGNAVSELLALSAQDGSRVWQTDLSPQQTNFVYVLNHPLATGKHGEVYAGYYLLDLVSAPTGTINMGESFATARLSGTDGTLQWTQTMAGNTPGNGTYCGGCGPILASDPSGNHVYVSGAYPLGDSLLTTESLNATSGAVEWSGLYAWSAGALVDQLPEAIVAPSSGGAAIVGGANNAADSNPVLTCSICYDFAALVYPGAASAPAQIPDSHFALLLPLAGVVMALPVLRRRRRRI